MKVKEESEKAGLKLNVKKKKTKMMALRQIGEKLETVTFYFLGLQKMVTAAMKLKGTCSLEEKL